MASSFPTKSKSAASNMPRRVLFWKSQGVVEGVFPTASTSTFLPVSAIGLMRCMTFHGNSHTKCKTKYLKLIDTMELKRMDTEG